MFPPLMAAFALGMQKRHAYDDDDDDGSMELVASLSDLSEMMMMMLPYCCALELV